MQKEGLKEKSWNLLWPPVPLKGFTQPLVTADFKRSTPSLKKKDYSKICDKKKKVLPSKLLSI